MRSLTINIIAGPFLPVPPLKGGGIEIYLYNIALELSKKHHVRIYSRQYKGLKRHENIGGLEIIRLKGFEKSNSRILELFQDLIFAIVIFFKIDKADINHFFNLKAFLLYLLHPKRHKTVVHLQTMFKGATAKFLRFADSVVTLSVYVTEYFKANERLKTERMTVIPNGVNIIRFKQIENTDALKEKRLLDGYKVIGYAGRVAGEKGVNYLVEAFRILKDRGYKAKLLIIGPYNDDEYGDFRFYSYLKSHIKDRGMAEDIIFTGLVRHDMLPQYYAACDILSFPSTWEEPFGVVSIEAMACGKPVIVTDSGAFNEIVTDGINGFIVPKRDPLALVEKISLLLDNEPLRNRISAAAAERAKSYSFPSLAARYETLYSNLIREYEPRE